MIEITWEPVELLKNFSTLVWYLHRKYLNKPKPDFTSWNPNSNQTIYLETRIYNTTTYQLRFVQRSDRRIDYQTTSPVAMQKLALKEGATVIIQSSPVSRIPYSVSRPETRILYCGLKYWRPKYWGPKYWSLKPENTVGYIVRISNKVISWHPGSLT